MIRTGSILWLLLWLLGAGWATAWAWGGGPLDAPAPTPAARLYLPVLFRLPPSFACPAGSTNSYASGPAWQYDLDDPVRPAVAHADKNLALRGYARNNDAGFYRELVNYGTDDPTPPPQLATLFDPPRVPPLVGFYRVHDWNWAPSPAPGSRGDPLMTWPITALGLQTTPGEALRVPTSAYDIGQGFEVIVLYADERRVALRYAREDSAGAQGYTVHVDGLCTDPNLLALYSRLDASDGPRYVYRPPEQRPYTYPLPVLAAGQVIGLARTAEVVVAVVDSGSFMDPRSCNEWWQIRPGYAGACPPHE
ncbi:MAG: hypothetical protein ACP5UQ_15585 [Anaerolineae bacterium]